MSSPKVSVIIPAYNRAHLIGVSLRSVLAQAFGDYEIVVVDDGSTDNTGDVVRSVAPGARYIRQENQGIPGVLNRCVTEARGQYISFLGDDDALAPGALAREAAILDAHPNVGFVHGTAWLMDQDGCLMCRQRPHFARGDYVRSGREETADLLLSNHIVAPTVMARRRCFEDVGLFDLRFQLYEDWNMWMRILKRWDVAFVYAPITFYRVHRGVAGSVFRMATPAELDRNRRLQIDEVLGDPDVPAELRRMRARAYAAHELAVAVRCFDAGQAWSGRWRALRALTGNAFGALGPQGRAAAWLLAKSLVPEFAISRLRRACDGWRDAEHDEDAETLTIESILQGAAVPEG